MTRSGQSIATMLGAAVAAMIAIAVPGGYIASSLSRSQAELRTAAEITAGLVTDFVASSPATWEYQEPRLVYLIEHAPTFTRLQGHWEVLNRSGEVLAGVGETPQFPVASVSAPIFDAGIAVGQVRASVSLRNIAYIGAALTLLGLALGLSVYLTVRRQAKIRQRAEDALQERDSRYRTVVETSSDGFLAVDREGRLLDVNDAYVRRSGYTREELLRMRIGDLEARESAADIAAHIETILNKGFDVFETLHRARDGSVWPVEATVRHRSDRPGQILCFLRDITARRQAEVALREREARYRAVMQASTDGYWEVDPTGRILEVNDRYLQLSGYTREELLRMTVFDIAAKESPEGIKANLNKTRIEGSRILEVSHRAKDGRKWLVENSTVYVPLDGGRFHSFLRDITERKRVEEELKRYAQTLSEVTSQLTLAEERERRAIAVDLHDDLTQLLIAANLKLRSLLSPGDSADNSRALQDAMKVIEQAERSVRSVSFQISPPLLFELGLVPALEGLAEELRKVYGLTAIVHDDGKPKDLGPTTRSVLYRVARELLINVAKHAKAEIADVDVRCDDGALVISVTDSGVGFDKELVEKRAPGAGFGLASIKERLRLIGGRFEIDSNPGDGTVATLAVPLAAAADAANRASANFSARQ